MLKAKLEQSGISLVELMVAIAIALILLVGILTLMLRVSSSGASSAQSTRLNQQLRSNMDYMNKELQRAGYVDWYDAWDDDDDSVATDMGVLTDVNGDGSIDIRDHYISLVPRLKLFGPVTLQRFPTPGVATGTPTNCVTDCDCALYSYDLDEDGLQGVGVGGSVGTSTVQDTDNFELFGFRWNQGVIEVRTDGDNHECNSGTWDDLTDDNVEITLLALSQSFATGTSISTGNDSTAYEFSGVGDWGNTYQSACTPVDTDAGDPLPVDSDRICFWRRKVDITLRGQLTDDTGVQGELQSEVKIKNDFFEAIP